MLDVQVSKEIQLGRYRLRPNVGLYNALNASSVISLQGVYGPEWQRPLEVLTGRMLQVSGELRF